MTARLSSFVVFKLLGFTLVKPILGFHFLYSVLNPWLTPNSLWRFLPFQTLGNIDICRIYKRFACTKSMVDLVNLPNARYNQGVQGLSTVIGGSASTECTSAVSPALSWPLLSSPGSAWPLLVSPGPPLGSLGVPGSPWAPLG